MERIGSVERKTRTRVFDEGHFRGYTEYLIESEAGARPAPQAFLVHQQPGWVLPVHFHLEEQFQVVVGGHGSLGKHAVAPITVHYTSRESGYGPLVAGELGLDYLSLRAVTDPGAWYLPASREKMRLGLRKRQWTQGPVAVGTAQALKCRTSVETEVLSDPDGEGLAAWLLRLPARATAQAPAPAGQNGGRFHVVVGGSLVSAEGELGMHACIWRDADEPAMRLEAAAEGLAVLVLQFPASALDREPQRLDAAPTP